MIEDAQLELDQSFVSYGSKAMHLYRKKIRAEIDVHDDAFTFLHQFQIAKTWKEIVHAFDALKPKVVDDVMDWRMAAMLMSQGKSDETLPKPLPVLSVVVGL